MKIPPKNDKASILPDSRSTPNRSGNLYTVVLITATLIAASVILLPLWKQYRQQKLNDELFAAIRANDVSVVHALLEADADAAAHTRLSGVSFRDFLLAKISRRPRPEGAGTLSVAIALALDKNMRGPYPAGFDYGDQSCECADSPCLAGSRRRPQRIRDAKPRRIAWEISARSASRDGRGA